MNALLETIERMTLRCARDILNLLPNRYDPVIYQRAFDIVRRATPKTLYVHRPLLNYVAVANWAKANGFASTLNDDMHVTIAFSREPLDWSKLEPRQDQIEITNGKRSLAVLGDTGDATVLHFDASKLKGRWKEFLDAGASWDWPDYKPHVTISYKADGVDINSIPPYDGTLVFGPEVFDEVNEEFKDQLEEKDFDEGKHPRDEHGRWTDGSGGEDGGGEPIGPIPTPQGDSNYGLVPGDAEKFRALKVEWAKVNNDLLAHIDKPDGPEAQAKMRQLESIAKQIQGLHADPGGPAGIGLPGGPRDVTVVGAGPGGLAACINGAAEGLDTLVVEAQVVAGGQAKYSSRIENFPGFPIGITGERLTQSMFTQAERLGAGTALGVRVVGMSYNQTTGMKHLTLSNGEKIDTRTVILAGGVEFRKLNFPGSEGPGVIVGDGKALAGAGKGGNVVVVGGSNGAAQAALGCAPTANHVYLMARSSIIESMSDYQVVAVRNNPKVTVIEGDSIKQLNRDANGQPLSVETAKGQTLPVKAVGEFIGSLPNTKWVHETVQRDKGGRLRTNPSLETDLPGVYCVGDMREGAIGRVGVAVGEGQLALRQANVYLDTLRKTKSIGAMKPLPVTRANASPLITDLFQLDRENPWFGQTVEGVEPLKKIKKKDFDEGKHPRDEHGRWSESGGGGDGESGGGTGTAEYPKDWIAYSKETQSDHTGISSNFDIRPQQPMPSQSIIVSVTPAGMIGTSVHRDTEVLVNPKVGTVKDLINYGGIAEGNEDYGVRALQDRAGNVFVWPAYDAIHQDMMDALTPVETMWASDIWEMKGGKLTSVMGSGTIMAADWIAKGQENNKNADRTSVGFVSPQTRTDLDFNGAVEALKSPQQGSLLAASTTIDRGLGIIAKEASTIGAWQDGAENSIMMTAGSDWDHTVAATVMKGHLADQKQVLVFQQQRGGDAVLASFRADGKLEDIHKNLLEDGLAFHTLVPSGDGATVYVADTDGSLADTIEKAAGRYDARINFQTGRAQFIGDTEEFVGKAAGTGTDREQRDRARSVYEKSIGESPVSGVAATWSSVRDRWGQTAK